MSGGAREHARRAPFRQRRRVRILAFLLALFSVAGTVAFLLAELKLHELRDVLQAQIQSRFGVRLDVGGVSLDGLRGVRAYDLAARVQRSGGFTVDVRVPSCRLNLEPVDWLYGEFNIELLELESADVIVERAAVAADADRERGKEPRAADFAGGASFRVLGRDCRVELRGFATGPPLVFESLNFDLARLTGNPAITARADAVFGNNAGAPLQADIRFASLDDFDLHLACRNLAAPMLAAYVPRVREQGVTGSASPSLRLAGYPDGSITAHLEMGFAAVAVGGMPPYLEPQTGALTVLGRFDRAGRVLTVEAAQAHTNQFAGRLAGRVSLASVAPDMDLTLDVDQVPAAQALAALLPFEVETVGTLSAEVFPPARARVHAAGVWPEIAVDARAELGGGAITFAPADKKYPEAQVVFGGSFVEWSTLGGLTGGHATIVDGSVNHAMAGVRAQSISGNLRVEQGAILVDPIRVEITGNPFVGRARFDLEKREGQFEVQGALSNIEKTLLSRAIKDTEITGSAAVRCEGAFSKERISLDASADLTQTAIEHDWWFYKPAGIGASLQGVNLEMVPHKTLTVSGGVALAMSTGNATIESEYRKGHWRMEQVRVQTDHVDATSLGQCLRIPYALNKGTATDGYFTWERAGDLPESAMLRFGGLVDGLIARVDGVASPIEAYRGRIDVTLDNSKPEVRTGDMRIALEEGLTPPFGEDWIREMNSDPVLKAKYPDRPRSWTVSCTADKITAPPWKGTAFKATGVWDDAHTDFNHFEADVDGGRLEGAYRLDRADNVMALDATWDNIPAFYLLDHLHYARLLDGRATGRVNYEMDRDDPATLHGAGTVSVRDGQFSADAVISQFRELFEGNLTGLPPSLRFSQLDLDLVFEGDHVKTPAFSLTAEGVRVNGSGQYVTKADMDYTIQVAIRPDVAARMPTLRDYFNVAGHRVSQNDIELAFKVKGPSFNPSGEVVALPSVGVTVVSGAAELGTEAMRVLDTPRQILIDLFKIGGVIVGTGR